EHIPDPAVGLLRDRVARTHEHARRFEARDLLVADAIWSLVGVLRVKSGDLHARLTRKERHARGKRVRISLRAHEDAAARKRASTHLDRLRRDGDPEALSHQ